MNETHLEIQQSIEQAQNLQDLILVKAGIEKSTDLLLVEFEEKILDRVLELLTEQEDRHWCTQEEFAFLVAGLDSRQKDKYKQLLTLATNTGISDFQSLNNLWSKFLQENEGKLKSFEQNTDVLPALQENHVRPRINGARRAINQGEFGPKSEGARRKRKPTPEQPIPEIDKLPFKEIVDNLYQLSLAALRCEDKQKQLVVLETFEDSSFDKQYEGYDLFDVLKFAHLYHPDVQVRRQAQYVLETFTALGAYVAEDIRGRYTDDGEIEIVHLSPRREASKSQLQDNVRKSVAKGAILETVFDRHITLADDRTFNREIKSVGFNSLTKMNEVGLNLPAFHERPESFTYDPLANEVVKFIMEQELLLLKKEGNFGGLVLPSRFTTNNPENILLTWRGNITRDHLKKMDPSMLLKLNVDMPNLLNVSNKPLEIVDLAAVLAFLRPELDLDESIPLEELKDQARGGMFPISKRGVRINLDKSQDQDKYLTEFGLKQITFKRTGGPNNLEVTLQLGKRTFSFEINEQMETPALAGLASAERNWLERIVFSYLLAVKNRDLYQSTNLAPTAEKNEGNQNQETEEERVNGQKRQEASNSSHLYVLPYSHQPKDWDDPYSSINQEVKEEFGYSLLELNLHFSLAQQDPKYLETLEDKTLRRIVLASLKRLEDKDNPENWKLARVQNIKAKIREAMLGAGMAEEQIGEAETENIALVGFMHEPSNPVGPPLQVKINGVSSQLFAKP